ncbi:hypothetical protein MMC29_002728 [Sticta canariensis]|nr:hypothetical protein [Sticta canariensis]
MAFRQPTVASARQVSAPEAQGTTANTLSSTQPTSLEQSQQWVLFSSSQAQSSSKTKSTRTERTPRTAGLSRLSDFGSLNTLARSGQHDGDISEVADEAGGEDEDFDSLDEGLHAFQEPPLFQSPRYFDQSGSILPTHDGLGTFQASSAPVQEQLWHFEKQNPRKRSTGYPRRTSSVQRQLDAVADDDVARVESERMARIETWRMEQSKFLLESIEKATRRREMSASGRRAERDISISGTDKAIQTSRSSDAHAPDQGDSQKANSEIEDESLFGRITRRIIRDLLGIDEALLSVIFGESLPGDDPFFFGSSTPDSNLVGDWCDSTMTATWDTRLLERIARELGILVQQLTDHPGAFSTPLNPAHLDYAGIPVTRPPLQTQPELSAQPLQADTGSASARFKPTLEAYQSRFSTSASDTTHAALWGIEEEPTTSSPSPAAHEGDYWERTPDLGAIFRVFHHRFSSPHQPSTSTPNIATTATPASLRRAAVIRQHHPLVSRAAVTGTTRRSSRNAAGISHHYHHYRRAESSCKSLSVRKGGRGGSGSSRNYWDLGGGGGSAAGSALAAAAGGGIGAWGEI